MFEGSVRRMAVLAGALILAACSAGAPPKPLPKPAPEPTQATPSAEALGPARVADSDCAQPPENGEILEGAVLEEGLNYYQVMNLTDAPAVVKIRTGVDGPLVVAFYVAPHQTASVGPLADGTYRQTQAMGGAFAADCSRLDYPSGYGQYDKSDVFAEKLEDGKPVGRTQTYTLEERDVDGGDGPQALTAEKFNAP